MLAQAQMILVASLEDPCHLLPMLFYLTKVATEEVCGVNVDDFRTPDNRSKINWLSVELKNRTLHLSFL